MGNTGSIFYPSNPDRRRRAEQLKNDCEIAQADYKRIRASIENFLKPLQGKLDDVLKAMGCNTLHEFDQKVSETATGEALADWERVKKQYDTTDTIEASIWATCGIIAIGGFTISAAMGLFSFGIGFVAGLTVTAGILAVLGAIGLILDAILGAIERAQLREAIENLCTARLKIKQLVNQSHAMELALPSINRLWDSIIENSGNVDRGVIIQMIADDKEGLLGKPWTYERSALALKDLDRSRGSWTDEDPDFLSLAKSLDYQQSLKSVVTSRGLLQAKASVKLTNEVYMSGLSADLNTDPLGPIMIEYYQENPDIAEAIMTTSTVEDNSLQVIITPVNGEGTAPIFNTAVQLAMNNVLSEERGLVAVTTSDGREEQYVAEVLDFQDDGEKSTTSAQLLLFSVDMPTKCLQPDGSFSLDREQGKLSIRFV